MLNLIKEVLNGKKELKGVGNPAWVNYFFIMIDIALMEDTNHTINKDYFERLYENLKKDYSMEISKNSF